MSTKADFHAAIILHCIAYAIVLTGLLLLSNAIFDSGEKRASFSAGMFLLMWMIDIRITMAEIGWKK